MEEVENPMTREYEAEMKRIQDLEDASRGMHHIETVGSGSAPALARRSLFGPIGSRTALKTAC